LGNAVMIEQPHRQRWDKEERSFDMRELWRLAIWGAAATVGLAAVVLAANTNAGSQRLVTAVAPASSQLGAAELAARSAETENQTRRLSEAVRALDADRERLLTRVASLERSLEDITGSIRRQAASPPANPTPREPVASVAEPAAAAAATGGAPVSGDARTAALPANDDAEAKNAKPEIGVDVGGAANFEGLRLLWNSTSAAHTAQFEHLHPLVAVRENRRTRAAELRLLVGPFADSEAAAAVCAALASIRRSCQPAPFEGQPFSLAEPEVRPATPPARRLPAAPKTVRQNP
jgi:phage shock protein A